MVNTLCTNFNGSSNPSTANTTEYWPVGGASNKSATETDAQIMFRSGGTVTNLFINITANTIAGTSTFDFRVNAASSALTISIGSSASGIFEDTTHSVTVNAGDKCCFRTVPGATTNTMTPGGAMSVHYDNVTTTIQKCVSSNPAGFAASAASTSRYWAITGNLTGTATEALANVKAEQAGTAQNLAVNAIVNARTTATTVALRKGAANSALTLSITASTTGFFEDTTHTVSIAAADLIDYVETTGLGTGTLTVTSVAMEITSAVGYGILTMDTGGGTAQTFGITRYSAVMGWLSVVSTETTSQLTVRSPFTFSNMNVRISLNSNSSASTFQLRKNLTNANLVVSITGSTTGLFEDITHSDTTTAGDKMNVSMTTAGASGTLSWGATALYTQLTVGTAQTIFVEWEES